MKYVFKSLGNKSKVDLIPYIKAELEKRNDISLYVGCDSQSMGSKTVYAIVIVLHYGNNGGHVLYSKMNFERIRDSFSRLWKEVEMSLEVARFLESEGIRTKYIDIDINPDPKYRSNSVLRAALGLIESYGYTARCKPNSIVASCCADRICHM